MFHRHLCKICIPPSRWNCRGLREDISCPGLVAGKALSAPCAWHTKPGTGEKGKIVTTQATRSDAITKKDRWARRIPKIPALKSAWAAAWTAAGAAAGLTAWTAAWAAARAVGMPH